MTADDAAACLRLDVAVDGAGRSFLARQFVRYPLHLGRALYLDAAQPGRCTLALQSVSGGLFEGDRLLGHVTLQAGAQARLVTSASTIVHGMRPALCAEQATVLCAGRGAQLVVAPEPLILFPTSRLHSRTTVHLAEGATVLLCESFLAHTLPSNDGHFAAFDAQVDVQGPAGELLARERLRLTGVDWATGQPGISAGFGVHGTLWLLQADAAQDAVTDLLARLRTALALDGVLAGASSLPNRAGVQVRLLCQDAVAWRQALQQALAVVQDGLRLGASLPPRLALRTAASPNITATAAA